MATRITWLTKESGDTEIDKMLLGILEKQPAGVSPYQEISGAVCSSCKTNDIHHRQIMLAELILIWLANQNLDSHPFLRLFQNEKYKPADQKFLGKATEIINEHLSDPLFGIEAFAAEMAVSRSQLFRKFVALTGNAPSNFIRRIRLMRAANLIEQKFGNITEIALEVGYNSSAYFTQCFRSHFGIPPSQYAKNFSKN